MSPESQPPALLRFGIFEVNLRSGELRKQGVRIKLQEQPFLVLKVLLGRPGEIATREELRSKIWSADTFVDFDSSLNTSINKLREALGDSAENPRFIETVPRRGYRFIAPVTGDDRKAATLTPAWKIVVPVTLVAVAVLAGGLFWRTRQGRRLTDKDTIILGDFTNSTGDAIFDGTLREGLSVELEQSPFLSLVSDEQVHEALRMMRQESTARLTPEIVREICQRTSSAAALEGSIALIGSRYNLILKAISCADGNVLASAESQANDKSHVLDALGKVASEMRSKLGESLSTLQKYNTPLEQATTPSIEALQSYSLGFRAVLANDNAEALSFFQRATELDPNFAMAYVGLGYVYSGLGEPSLAVENFKKAYDFRGRVSEREKLVIESAYYWIAIGDLEKARQTEEVQEQTYPRDEWPPNDLSIIYHQIGEHEKALAEAQEAVRRDPTSGRFYATLAYAYLNLNRFDEAQATAEEALAKKLDSPYLRFALYHVAFLQNNAAGMAKQVAWSVGKPGVEDVLLLFEADSAAYAGRLWKARELSGRAVASAERAGEKETAGGYQAEAALREAFFGNAAYARLQAAAALALSTGRDVKDGAALALALAGDAARAQALADDLAKRFPEDTVVQFNYLPTLHAQLALSRTDASKAIEVLQAVQQTGIGVRNAPYELGSYGALCPVFVRGEAYLAAHQGSEAAAEFQKILDHRGIVLNEPIGALANLQIGRAYAMQGDTAKAKAAYQDFLRLWKDADPDIPILQQAKAEYEKLK